MNEIIMSFIRENAMVLFLRVILGGIATFLAILVWARIRKISIFFFILGVVSTYISILYQSLWVLGFIVVTEKNFLFFPITVTLLENLPIVFFIFALIFLLKEKAF